MNTHLPFFEVLKQDSLTNARLASIRVHHGVINTPAFMPVGTQATVKTLDIRDLHEIGSDIILANTYHLHLRPGEDLVSSAGGVHRFMGWDKPILTDSGGFQVFSLASKNDVGDHSQLVSIDNQGVTFRSHIDGSEHRFTPKSAIQIQQKLGADIIMAFDQCTRDDVSESVSYKAMVRTHEWAIQCIDAMENKGPHNWQQYLFGIIQGGRHESLRKASTDFITSLDFDGIAIGGESVGYNMEATVEILNWIQDKLPENKPRYTMGVGSSPVDIIKVVEMGIDMFDCVVPTRMARNGGVFCKEVGSKNKYRFSITKSEYKEDFNPISDWCNCRYCKADPPVTRQYLHHLFKARELLGPRIATYHNLHFLEQFMEELRASLKDDNYIDFVKEWK